MRISPEILAAEAETTGFRAEIMEKSVRLLALLDAICDHPLLEGKLALKGGTALNLFVFNVPRLSVDIDLNYVGGTSRGAMLEERPRIEAAIQTVFRREDFAVRRMPEEHAGGKWSLRYADASGQRQARRGSEFHVPRTLVARHDHGLALPRKLARHRHSRGGPS